MTTAPRPTTKTPPPPDAPPLDLAIPRPNPGETVTLTAVGVGSEWTVYSSRTEHRVTRKTRDDERQLCEWPWDEWAAAARYVVSCVNGEYVRAGSAPSTAPVYCGDCGGPATRLADGKASCAKCGTP